MAKRKEIKKIDPSSHESIILTLKNTSYKELFDLNDAVLNTSMQHRLEKQWNTLWNNYIDIIMEKNKMRHRVIPKRNKNFEELYEDTKLVNWVRNTDFSVNAKIWTQFQKYIRMNDEINKLSPTIFMADPFNNKSYGSIVNESQSKLKQMGKAYTILKNCPNKLSRNCPRNYPQKLSQ